MAAATPVFRAAIIAGFLETEWDVLPDQASFKVSVTRTAPVAHSEPSYGTERYKGQFATELAADGTPHAHLIHNEELNWMRWNGSGYTSGRLCNGTYTVRMYYINNRGERSTTQTVTGIVVSNVPCSPGEPDEEPDTVDGELPAPTMTRPNASEVFNATNVIVDWDIPSGYHQAQAKVAVYRAEDIQNDRPFPNGTPRQGSAVYGSIRNEGQRNDSNRSHYFRGSTSRVTFSDTSPNANAQICNGSYVVRVRYKDSQGSVSAPGIRAFSVTGVPCDEPTTTPLEPDVPVLETGEGGYVEFVPTDRMFFDGLTYFYPVDEHLDLRWNSTFINGQPQAGFILERQHTVVGRPNEGRDYWTGGGPAGTDDIFEQADFTIATTSNGYLDDPTPRALIRGGAPNTSSFSADHDKYWWHTSWNTLTDTTGRPGPLPEQISFLIHTFDAEGNYAAATGAGEGTVTDIKIGPYRKLGPVIDLLTNTARNPWPVITFTSNYQGYNNRPKDLRVSVFERNTDGSRGDFVAGTTQFRDQPLTGSGEWVDLQAEGVNPGPATLSLIVPMIYADFFSGPLAQGNYLIDVWLRDRFGNVNERASVQFNWTPPAVRIRDIRPVRIVSFDNGKPNFGTPTQGDPPTTAFRGLAPGEGIAIAYYAPTTGALPSHRAPDDLLIQRREFRRADNVFPNYRPVDLFRWSDRVARAAWPNAMVGSSLPTSSALVWWWYDFTVESGVQYEYRAVLLDTRTGGRLERPWVPA